MAARGHEAFLVRLLWSGKLAVGQKTLLRFLLLSGALIGLLSPGPSSREPALPGASVSSKWPCPDKSSPQERQAEAKQGQDEKERGTRLP